MAGDWSKLEANLAVVKDTDPLRAKRFVKRAQHIYYRTKMFMVALDMLMGATLVMLSLGFLHNKTAVIPALSWGESLLILLLLPLLTKIVLHLSGVVTPEDLNYKSQKKIDRFISYLVDEESDNGSPESPSNWIKSPHKAMLNRSASILRPSNRINNNPISRPTQHTE